MKYYILYDILGFWTPDSKFSRIRGVKDVVVGYAGGFEDDPCYEDIKDYTEAVRIEYDPKVISYEEILEEFNRQNGDPTYGSFGRQYRTAILYHSPDQKKKAEDLIKTLRAKYSPSKKICIDLEPATDFYRAEEYHQKFNEKQYCRKPQY